MPFMPTHIGPDPATCFLCSNLAVGMGFGDYNWKYHRGDLKLLCKECLPYIGKIKDLGERRLEILELKALDGAVDGVGDYLDTIGVTDLALMDELDARMICKYAIEGYAKRIRQLVRGIDKPL